jgi:hypothetical protein
MVGLALPTTALGTPLPILRDAGQFESEFGRLVLAAGAVGEFGPVVAVARMLSVPAVPDVRRCPFVQKRSEWSLCTDLKTLTRPPPWKRPLKKPLLGSHCETPFSENSGWQW